MAEVVAEGSGGMVGIMRKGLVVVARMEGKIGGVVGNNNN